MALLPQFITLNEYVSVSARTDELTNEFLMWFKLVVIGEPSSQDYVNPG
jgi:hypothetical protein